MHKIFIVFICLVLLALSFFGAYTQESLVHAGLFVVILIISVALYLFVFGLLSEFSIEAFSAKAKFVREKVEQTKQDLEELEALKFKAIQTAREIEKLRFETETNLEKIREKLSEVETLALLNL